MKVLLTNKGADLASVGFVTGEFPKISKVKFGDGNGVAITHTPESTNIARLVYEAKAVSGLREERVTNIVAVIPIEIGGFTVREIGLYTEQNELVAITETCNFYKPNMDDDPTQETLYLRISISDTQAIDIEFNTDILYAPQSALDESNEHIQILYDELRKKKLLMLNSSSVLLDGNVDLKGKENMMFSNTIFYTGDGISTGQAINLGMQAKNFNVKNNGSGFYLDYNSSTNTLLVRDDNDVIIPEGDISFDSVKVEIYRYDVASDKFRYSSVIGMEKSHSMTVDTAAVETVSNHVLSLSGSTMMISKVSNTLNGKYICNAKYMDRIRWYTAPDGGVWVQAYNLATDYFITHSRVTTNTDRIYIRNPLNKPLDYIYYKGINISTNNYIHSSSIGETRAYIPSTGVVIVSATTTYWDSTAIDYFFSISAISAGIHFYECFANSKYMHTGTFTMSSASDNVIDIKDIEGNDRLITTFKFKSLGGNGDPLKHLSIKDPKIITYPYNTYYNNNVRTSSIFSIEKGKFRMIDFATFIAPTGRYHYVVEFDSELSNVIDNIGVL